MDIYAQIAAKIIEQQEAIIGPVATEQAKRVSGLHIDWSKHAVQISGNPSHAIDELVRRYERLFGTLSVEVCRDASAHLIAQLPPDKLPASLR